MVHFIFLIKLATSRNIKKLVSQFLDHRNQRYNFCKNSSNPKSNKGEREADRGDPWVNGPHRQRPESRGMTWPRRSRRWRGLGHGQEHHRAPHSIPHRMVPETLTLPDPRYLALAHGGTAVVRGWPPASRVGDRAKESSDEHQHDLAELLGEEWSEMADYRALATTPVTMAELRRGKLATEKTMRAYRSSAAAANLTTLKRRS